MKSNKLGRVGIIGLIVWLIIIIVLVAFGFSSIKPPIAKKTVKTIQTNN